MHYTKNEPTYESIRPISVLELLLMNNFTLKRLEKEIQQEVYRAQLSLKWIQGIRRIKKAKENGGNNG